LANTTVAPNDHSPSLSRVQAVLHRLAGGFSMSLECNETHTCRCQIMWRRGGARFRWSPGGSQRNDNKAGRDTDRPLRMHGWGSEGRDSSGRLAAPGGMTIKRDDTQVVPYENCWLAARSIGLYATPRWGAVARDSSGRLAAPGGMTIKRDDTQVVPYEDSCWRSDGARFLWSPGGSRRNDI